MPSEHSGLLARAFALIFRLAIAFIAFGRIIVLIRVLNLHEFALVAVLEAAAGLIGVLVSGGIGDALLRAGVSGTPRSAFGALVGRSFVSSIGIGLVGVVVLVIFIRTVDFGADASLVGWVALTYGFSIVSGRVTGIAVAAVRTWLPLASYYWVTGTPAALKALAQIGGAVWGGLSGYIFATLAAEFLSLLFVIGFSVGQGAIDTRAALRDWHRAPSVKQVSQTALSVYIIKIAAEAGRRLPLVILGIVSTPAIYSSFAAAIQLTSRMQIINQALTPLIVPTTGRAQSQGLDAFRRAVRKEAVSAAVINLGAATGAVGIWWLLGPSLFGIPKWTAMNLFLHLALLGELFLAGVVLCNVAVLIHSPKLALQAAASVVLQIAMLPAMIWTLSRGPDGVLKAMLVVVGVQALLFTHAIYSSVSALRARGNSDDA